MPGLGADAPPQRRTLKVLAAGPGDHFDCHARHYHKALDILRQARDMHRGDGVRVERRAANEG
jgi:hypothetical protein